MEAESQLICDDRTRRRLLLADPALNGIDSIEVPWNDQTHVHVYFVKPAVPLLDQSDVIIKGGVRVNNIKVEGVGVRTDVHGVDYLEVTVDQAGDFSIYTLVIRKAGVIDPGFGRKPFSFKAGCPTDFDCAPDLVCPPESVETPLIDYLAKDYASFRKLLLDLIPSRIPHWTDRHEADLGIALVELMAYVGDYLSYYQDAVANEAFLETARQRESIRRHVKLIDYPMHEGANARVFVHVTVQDSGVIPQGTAILTRIDRPVEAGTASPPGVVIADSDKARALAVADAVFEAMEDTAVAPSFNQILIHTWGDEDCCLPRGAIGVDLVGDLPLQPLDRLLLEEVKSPANGKKEDADPEHRQVVRLVDVTHTTDPLMTLDATGKAAPRNPGDPALPVTRVRWGRDDQLAFPLCLSTLIEEKATLLTEISVARGNLILANHGLSVTESHPSDPDEPGILNTNTNYRFRLSQGPLTFHATRRAIPGEPPPSDSVRSMLDLSPRGAEPQVWITLTTKTGNISQWTPAKGDLLRSDSFAREFVVEMGNDGRALIRFGDNFFGRAPPNGSTLEVMYRVGNGRTGNVGWESLAHLVQKDPALPHLWPTIDAVRNPMLAWGGIDPESPEQVKQLAPPAFHAELYRAVTEADYAEAAEKLPEVSTAVGSFRWTGSWHTVFATVDPEYVDELSPKLNRTVRAFLNRYKQAGYDLEIDPPIYVPLEIEIKICASPDHFRAQVKKAVLKALSNRSLPDGRVGFFHRSNFTFGQPVYLSRLYEALESVGGVDSAEIVTFKQYGKTPNGELEKARIEMGWLEVARLDNDPNARENGVLTLKMLGGK